MARLIDADKINYHEHTECMGHGDFETVRTVTDKEIAEIPTVDAVPVVRCRECIAYTPVDDNTGKCVFLIGEHQYVVPDGYCYLGERKEGADNDT